MPDINPAELSRTATIGHSTPILSHKSITVSAPSLQKTPKVSQIIPARIELEPVYSALKSSITSEQWVVYKETVTQFLIGRLHQSEFSEKIDPILASPNGEKEHLHNQLIAAIYGNVTRDLPDQGLAPWVSANDKPSTAVGSKPVTGDAAERRLKGEVMQLPSRDRRRIKDLALNEVDPYETLAGVFSDHGRAKAIKGPDVPASAGGLNRMNWDLEIRKRYAQPLAVESGEFPDTSNIEARMLPFCYEAGLVSGHVPEAAQFVNLATESFIKEFLSAIFGRTRSNGPAEIGGTGHNLSGGASWIQTHRYRKQLAREEEAARRGEIPRDKGGLLPIESRSASEQGPLGMADLRLALEMGDCGLATFPLIGQSIKYNYREGELENWQDYTWIDGHKINDKKPEQLEQLDQREREPRLPPRDADGDVRMIAATNGEPSRHPPGSNATGAALPNGVHPHDDTMMDVDDDLVWEGADPEDGGALDSVLDSCLAV